MLENLELGSGNEMLNLLTREADKGSRGRFFLILISASQS